MIVGVGVCRMIVMVEMELETEYNGWDIFSIYTVEMYHRIKAPIVPMAILNEYTEYFVFIDVNA